MQRRLYHLYHLQHVEQKQDLPNSFEAVEHAVMLHPCRSRESLPCSVHVAV